MRRRCRCECLRTAIEKGVAKTVDANAGLGSAESGRMGIGIVVDERGVRMQDETNLDRRMDNQSSGRSGLLAKVRARTERESAPSAAAGGSAYSAAALGQAPYVAMNNGVIVVQRKCSPWNC